MPSEAATEFLANIEPLLPDYRCLDLRVVAHEGDDGHLYLRALNATLLHTLPDEVAPLVGPSGEGFWSRHLVMAPAEVKGLIDQAESGSLRLDGRDLVFKEREGRTPSLSSFYHARIEGNSSPSMGTHLIGVGTSMATVPSKVKFDRLEAILRGLPTPWDGWEDVSRNFLGFERSGLYLDPSRPGLAFQLQAPLGVHLESVTVSASTIEVRLLAHANIDVDEVRLGFFAAFHARVERALVAMKGRAQGAHIVVHVPVPPGLQHAVFSAAYRGWEAGRRNVRIPGAEVENPRVAQIRHVLKGIDPVRDGLLDEGVRGRDLEPWFVMLLYQLGLQVAPTDKAGSKAGTVDILAMIPGNDSVFMVEMTEDAPDNRDKMRKLAVRAAELTESMRQDAFPILVTRLPSTAVPESDRQTAGREGIALVCREDLVMLAAMAEENRTQHELLQFLESRIPPNPDRAVQIGGRRRSPLAYL